MSRLQYSTIGDERPQGKPNVYFACHPDDFGEYFEEYAAKILRIQDCAIWSESEPEADYDRDDLELNLSLMQLIVMPITTKLLTTANRAMDLEFPLAKERNIPVLPIMMERGLDDMYSERFGDLQYLDPNNTDETRRSFDEVPELPASLETFSWFYLAQIGDLRQIVSDRGSFGPVIAYLLDVECVDKNGRKRTFRAT